jgi:hypothetical protein
MGKTLDYLWSLKPKEFERNLSGNQLVNIWLEEFFNTTIEEVGKDESLYPRNERGEYTYEATTTFHNLHKVSQQQYDWWEKEVKKLFNKKLKYPMARIDKEFWATSLQCGPSVF